MLRFVWLLLLTGCLQSKPGGAEPEPIERGRYDVGLIIVGDTGTGEDAQYQVARGIKKYCESHRCDAGLLLGDNIYPNGITRSDDPQMISKFEEPYRELTFAFYPVIGNHDDRGDWRAQVAYRSAHWIMPGRWYTHGDGELWEAFAIDTSYSAFQKKDAPQQRQWLAEKLAASRARWKITYGHYPVYSYGMHGDDAELKQYLKPLLEQHGVDFALAGHDHNKQLFEREGVNYVVSGAGAKSLGFTKPCGCDFRASTLGFTHLLLNKESALLRFMNQYGQVEYQKEFK